MARILHLETAIDECSAALSDGPRLVGEAVSLRPYDHAARLTLLIESCLSQARLTAADLDAICISMGPGSYTGLRIGFSTAKGLCFALDKPLIVVDTLRAWAGLALSQSPGADRIIPMIDARRMEVYASVFGARLDLLSPAEAVVLSDHSFEDHIGQDHRVLVCGNGAAKWDGGLHKQNVVRSDVPLRASGLIAEAWEKYGRGDFAEINFAGPKYLKSPNITTPKRPFLL